MATILENESAWSTTASTNANVDTGINWAENQDAATVNNSARGQMAARAKARLDQGGALVAGGTADALTVTTNQVLSSAHLAAGLFLAVRATATNATTTPTFAPDGLTAQPIKRADGSALAAGSIVSGMMLQLYYNAGSSEWRAGNITPATAPGMSSVALQRFTVAGTYTPTAGMRYCVIECVGGGGGGGAVLVSSQLGGAGGGGGGGYARLLASAATIGASQVVTVGAGGAGGTAGGAGVAGGDTSVGSLCVGKGGSAGQGAAANGIGAGGAGGVAGTGDLNIPGQAGSYGRNSASTMTPNVEGGEGGSAGCGWGAGAAGGIGSSVGAVGGNYGGGGGGGQEASSTGNRPGGAGAGGVVVITEYC